MISIEDLQKDQGSEIALIILICRVYFKTAEESQIQEFIDKNEIQWQQFLKSCSLHGVRPIIYKTIINYSVPLDIKARMQEYLVFLTAKNWNLALETERLILLLEANNIQVFPFKGAAFSKQFFGNVISRESNDIDLVIRKEDLPAIIQVMEDDGYLTDNEVYNHMGSRYLTEYKDLCFNKYENATRLFHVEFHWTVAERFLAIDPKAAILFGRQGEPITIFKRSVISLNGNNHFVAMMINHVCRDLLKDIKALIDLGKCIQSSHCSLNWDEIEAQIKNLRLEKGFGVSVKLVETLFGIKYPLFSPEIKTHITHRFMQQSLSQNPTGRIYLRSKAFFEGQLLLRENIHDKIKFTLFFLRHCFYPTGLDFRLINLPKSLFFVYPFLKPLRFLFKRSSLIEDKKRLIPKN